MKLQPVKLNSVLRLKAARQEDYGESSPNVLFMGYEHRQGFKTPFVKGKNEKGDIGFYKLSDFKSL